MRAVEVSLQKRARINPDCSSMVKKLRAMTTNAAEMVGVQKEHETFIIQLAGKTTPKGLHCLSMRLTAEYFDLKPEERELPINPDVIQITITLLLFLIMFCSVVVASTIFNAKKKMQNVNLRRSILL